MSSSSSDITDEAGAEIPGENAVNPEGYRRILLPELSAYFSPDYAVLDTGMGDADLDGDLDLALVMFNEKEAKNSETHHDATHRQVLFFYGENGKWVLQWKNDSLVLCGDCGGVFGDPYTDFCILRGSITIQHFGGSSWRWSRKTVFTFNKEKREHFLSFDQSLSFHASNPDSVETEDHFSLKNKPVSIRDFNIYH